MFLIGPWVSIPAPDWSAASVGPGGRARSDRKTVFFFSVEVSEIALLLFAFKFISDFYLTVLFFNETYL